MKFIKIIPLLIGLVLLLSCNEEPPLVQEGNAKITIYAVGDTSVIHREPKFIPLKNAKVILSSEYGMIVRHTDNYGKLTLQGIPSSTYNISVRLNHPTYPNILLLGNLKEKEIISGREITDTIKAVQVANTGIAINEIYACGPVNNIYFFFDQFIELYNYSEEVRYLDGMIVMRVSGNNEGKGPGADEGDDGDIDGVTYIFKFPGKPGENNYPFYPQTYITLAATGTNHKKVVSTAVDLSNADWEFYNQYSTTDFDSPTVKNLINIRSDRTVDFLINLVSDVIVLASGVDSKWEDGIDINTIIDGVEYRSSMTATKTLDVRIDKSFAVGPPRYSGKSLQRREPGGDSNDSVLDFEIIPVPTPGKK
ncbi:MAG: DUF4876 domain-containing protein [Bacteroidota bacterium]